MLVCHTGPLVPGVGDVSAHEQSHGAISARSGEPARTASTVPRGAVRLEAEAAMGLDSVVTLALGLGTGGTAERRLRPGPRPGGAPSKWGAVAQRDWVQGWVATNPPGGSRDSEDQHQGPLGPQGKLGNRGPGGR